jgi:four helix bundle protein
MAAVSCQLSAVSSELEYQLLLARDLNFMPPDDFQALMERTTEVKRMLSALISKLTADG